MLSRHGVPSFRISELESSSLPAMDYVRITIPDSTLYGGETVFTGTYGLEVIWTPGHSIGHICLYEPKNQILFAGDHILPKITPSVGYHTQSGDNPLGDYLHALGKLEHLAVQKVLPAHEDIFSDLQGRIAEIVEHHKERSEEIGQVISKGSESAYEISSRITWNVKDSDWENMPPLSKRLAVMETLAHLEYMRWGGRVRKTIRDDFVFFTLQ
jgi:glyoxylase-like metal-dependent hydrolase (beta-lactamase superfamily II)